MKDKVQEVTVPQPKVPSSSTLFLLVLLALLRHSLFAKFVRALSQPIDLSLWDFMESPLGSCKFTLNGTVLLLTPLWLKDKDDCQI